MTIQAGDEGSFLRQAAVIRAAGSPYIAALIEAGQRQLARAPISAALVMHWPGDKAAAALAMRFNGALNALLRRDRSPELKALSLGECDDFDCAVGAALAAEDEFIAAWMRDPPQTNEVGRAAAIMAALMVAGRGRDLDFSLLELGSSAGLNLNLAHYCYDLGGRQAGVAESPVRITPEWRGAPPPDTSVRIVDTRGVDLRPLDLTEDVARERLMAFVWTDEPARATRLEQAIAVARAAPPQIDCAHIGEWLPRQLAAPQPVGVCRVVFHSMVLQYLTVDERANVMQAIRTAGEHADDARPLAWISFEWTECRSEVRLLLTCWPSGVTRHLATCHPYGAWIRWHMDDGEQAQGSAFRLP